MRRLTDVEEIRELLEDRRPYAATALSYLAPRLFGRTEWLEGRGPEGSRALMLLVTGNAGGLAYTQGGWVALEPVLKEVRPFRRSYFTFETAQEPLLREHFILRHLQYLIRMHVTAEQFVPVQSRAVPLGPMEVDRVNDLYSIDSGAWISRRQLGEQVYYGIFESGKLVSVAGTQSVTRQYGVAVVANVMTHPEHRERGYARECVGALTEALLKDVGDVVLNVAPDNTPAIRVYQRLGYREYCRLAEGWAFWKGHTRWDRLVATLYDWFTR